MYLGKKTGGLIWFIYSGISVEKISVFSNKWLDTLKSKG